ncbi:MAG: D-2-hydroxyacid dehydrogenase [Alphaproteobacteria bacterium]|nr:MAG: D-2-hydroxyacid dehydrogenase [Alphaproteobacteria bacterium]
MENVDVIALNSPEEFEAAAPDIEYLIALLPPRGLWEKAPNLKLIQIISTGVDSLLPAPDLSDDVKISNARGIHGTQMAEFALYFMLEFAKNGPRIRRQHKEHEFTMFNPVNLSGSTLGIIGLGAIGEALAERAKALGMRVIATQRTPKPNPHVEKVYPSEQTAKLVEQADYLVLVAPLTDETRGLFDADMIARMKPNAVMVNLSRGGIVDETAIAKALTEGAIKGAAIDVFEQEPLPSDHPLWGVPNTIITPHMAAADDAYIANITKIFAENITRINSGQPLINEVDRYRGY